MRGRRMPSLPEKSVSRYRRVRGSCNLIAVLLLGYAILQKDSSVILLAIALITGLIAAGGSVGSMQFAKALQQMLYAFSLTLFAGAFVLMFL